MFPSSFERRHAIASRSLKSTRTLQTKYYLLLRNNLTARCPPNPAKLDGDTAGNFTPELPLQLVLNIVGLDFLSMPSIQTNGVGLGCQFQSIRFRRRVEGSKWVSFDRSL